MCEFISWIEKDGIVLCLDDATLNESRTKKLLNDSKDNDFLGHKAVRVVYDLNDGEGHEGELQSFWDAGRLPAVLRERLEDFEAFKKNFGHMIANYAQRDDLLFIVNNSPEDKARNERWKGLRAFCGAILVGRSEKRVSDFVARATLKEFPLTVDCGFSRDELVKKGGYTYVNPDFTIKNFPRFKGKQGKVDCQSVLVCIHGVAYSYEIEEVLKRLNLRPGDVDELLEFGAAYPHECKAPVVALRPVWLGLGCRRVPYLFGWHGERRLDLDYWVVGWNDDCCFLALRK